VAVREADGPKGMVEIVKLTGSRQSNREAGARKEVEAGEVKDVSIAIVSDGRNFHRCVIERSLC
jgi:hypothetical protein